MIVLHCIKAVSCRDSITSLLQYRPLATIGKAAEQREEREEDK